MIHPFSNTISQLVKDYAQVVFLIINNIQVMKEKCDKKTSCEVFATNGIFGDPCGGVKKYLTTTWECIPG